MVIGSFPGLATTYGQNALYLKRFAKRGPEARLYAGCFAAALLPTGCLFIFAWCSLPQVHWIGLNIGIACFMWAMFIIYQTVFTYLSDCYGTWASSASAGQSLARNLVTTAFPLFSTQMFERLTYQWAGTLFAFIALLMIPIPYVLFFWGSAGVFNCRHRLYKLTTTSYTSLQLSPLQTTIARFFFRRDRSVSVEAGLCSTPSTFKSYVKKKNAKNIVGYTQRPIGCQIIRAIRLCHASTAVCNSDHLTTLLPVGLKRPQSKAAMDRQISATSTRSITLEGLDCKSLQDVEEPIDPRINSSSRPSPNELDLSLTRQVSNLVQRAVSRPESNGTTVEAPTEKMEEPIYIDFKADDERNPLNFTKGQKWMITAIGCYSAFLASSVSSTYPMGFPSMIPDLNCNYLQAVAGLSVFTLALGVVPLVTASLSEEFGRKPLFVTSSFVFLIMFIMIALAQNIQTVIVGRFLQGAAGSTSSAMVAGTLTDIWSPRDRALPMTIYSVATIGGTGFGPIISGWIEMNPHLRWRWIQWIQMMYCGIYFILVFFIRETRAGVLLTHLAKKIRKETGDKRYRARIEDERASLTTLILISCTRPVYLTLTEPIVTAFSLWIGFAWGVTISSIDVIPLVFQVVYHFNVGLQGTTFVSMVIGSFFGLATALVQDVLYRWVKLIPSSVSRRPVYFRRNYAKRGPEARLHAACFAAVLLPVGLFIFAWCAFPQVNWIGVNIGIVCFMWAIFIIYQTVFLYLSDCYGTWAASASAGQGLTRNLVATAFSLFSTQMFERLTFKWAGTLFACLAVLLIPIPYILFFWGSAIRKRSKVASKLLQS
ncbi:hypothetical protein AX14_013005 [Amanita brunnescens Koide BX004]|nr:hypothetical protein AX14_013005 [Amanita brunnescens Koide BX004]